MQNDTSSGRPVKLSSEGRRKIRSGRPGGPDALADRLEKIAADALASGEGQIVPYDWIKEAATTLRLIAAERTAEPSDALLTETFRAMNGRDKWETLVLSGLIGTDEPWIPAMTQTLRDEAEALRKPVDDAAVERGCAHHYGTNWPRFSESARKDSMRDEVRAIITAALGGTYDDQ